MKAIELNNKAKASLILLMTLGASITIGLLSISGFLAVIPVVSLGITSFVLSVMYESEIYYKNLLEALDKLTNKDFHHQEHSNRYLEVLDKQQSTKLPAFLTHYFKSKKELEKKHCHSSSKELEKQLRLMERYFMKAVFYKDHKNQDYSYIELQKFLEENETVDGDETLNQEKLIAQDSFRNKLNKAAFVLSIATGAFYGIGTLFLLAEAIEVLGITIISATSLPFIVLPLCLISGTAFAMLIYNTSTNMIQHDSMRRWFKEIKDDFTKEPNVSSVFRGIVAVNFIAIGFVLTICTAGTWWTIANKVPKSLPFLARIPKVISTIFIPLFTGIGALLFNMENTHKSMSYFRPSTDDEEKITFKQKLHKFYIKPIKNLYKKESFLQFINPARALVFTLELPLKVIFFVGHLISIGATTNQTPYFSMSWPMFFSAASEALEDFHYFFSFSFSKKHKHTSGCNHEDDIPSKLIKYALSPFFGLSALWNNLMSNDSFVISWKKSWGHDWQYIDLPEQPHDTCHFSTENTSTAFISREIGKMQLNEQCELYKEVPEKLEIFNELKTALSSKGNNKSSIEILEETITPAKFEILANHRNKNTLFALFEPKTTSSEDFILNLKETCAKWS